jgi:hypothetical protein
MIHPNESCITHHAGGSVSITGPDATNYFRAVQLKLFIGLYIKTGIIPTRGVTISKMLKIATEYTGKKYKNSRPEWERAQADMDVWCATMKAALPIVNEGEPR